MGSVLVIPRSKQVQFLSERFSAQRSKQKPPRAFSFHGANEPFNDSDAAMLTDGAEARLDAAALAPGLESVAPELAALVADEVLRRLPGPTNRSGQELAHLNRAWLTVERGQSHDAA